MTSHHTPRLRTLCAVTLLCTSPLLLAAGPSGYYRWVDDKGAPQFTQKPPVDRPSEFVRTATGAASAVEGSVAQPAASEAGTEASEERQVTGGLEGVPDRDPAKCEQTRGTLGILNSSARIREKGSDGEYRYLTPAEIGEQKRLAEEAIKIYCD